MVQARRWVCLRGRAGARRHLPVDLPVDAGQASAEPRRARTRARRRAADQRRRRWTQRALTGTSGPAATSRHARPGQAAGPARRSVGRRADLEAAGRPGSRPGGVRWWSGCVGRSVPDGADDAQAPSPEDGLRSCRPVEEAAPVAVDLRARVGRRAVGSGGQTWWATGAGGAPARHSPRAASCAQAAADPLPTRITGSLPARLLNSDILGTNQRNQAEVRPGRTHENSS